MPLSAGTTLGPYEILSPLGAGGMGEVYRARDSRLNREVAIKVSAARFSERFEREARAIAALNHPHICTLHDVGPNYLVMELVEGTPLRGPLPLDRAVEYAGQILDALDAAHRKQITHRDLKPANILVTKQGVKLLDFGLAKQAEPLHETDATLTQALTRDGQIVGTLHYMSPEQLQGKETDARSDLFAFGCVLYEMLSGKRAFEGGSAASVIAAILEREPAPLDLHPPLGRVIKRCLSKDPDERFQTARDLKYNLRLAMEPPAAAPQSALWRWIATAAVVLAAFAGWGVSRSRQAASEAPAVRLQLNAPEGSWFDSGSLAVSPDGRRLAFVATVQNKRGLWIRPLDGTASRLLPGTDGAYFPFWSPDSRSLAYFAGTKLWRTDLAQGAPLEICDAGPEARGGAWSDDGTILFASFGSGLRRVPAAGGSPAPITALEAAQGEISHYWPQFLSGGRFLYAVRGNSEQHTGIYASTLDQPGQRTRLIAGPTQAAYAADHLLWLRGSTLVAQRLDADRLQLSGEPQAVADPVGYAFGVLRMNLAASPGGVLVYGSSAASSRLIWFGRAGNALGALGEPGAYLSFRLSPDGRRAAVSRASNTGSDVWMVELGRKVWSRFSSAPGRNSSPLWSPDGRTVVFRSGWPSNLYRKDASGAGSEQRITESANVQWSSDWSRDSRFLLYDEMAMDSQWDLWVLPVTSDGKPETGARPRPYLRTRFNERYGRFSPEPTPRWVAYHSDETGRDEAYIQAFPEPRGNWPVSTGGGRFPVWGQDGREIFYLAPDNKLMAVSLKLRPDSVEASVPRELFTAAWDESVAGVPYEVAPDGQRFLVRASDETGSQPLQVIVNWPALLKKGTAAE